MARYRIEIDKCLERSLKVVDTVSIHVNAPNMQEADNKLDKLLTEEPGFIYLTHIVTDNKKAQKVEDRSVLEPAQKPVQRSTKRKSSGTPKGSVNTRRKASSTTGRKAKSAT